jgi:hypothetical protein
VLYQLSYLPGHIRLRKPDADIPRHSWLSANHAARRDVRDSIGALQDFDALLSNFGTQDAKNRFDQEVFPNCDQLLLSGNAARMRG